MPTGGVKALALLLVVALTAGCTGGGDNGGDGGNGAALDVAAFEDASTEELAQELRSDFDDSNVSAMVEAFSRAGVTVYDDELTEPIMDIDGEESALQLIQFQARNMALELSADSGYPGSELDALAGSKKSPSIAKGLVDYASTQDTFGGELSSELLGEDTKDPGTVVFPTAVIALFLSDAAVEAGAEPPDVGAVENDDTIVLAAGPHLPIAQDEDEEDEVEEGEEGEEEEEEDEEEPGGGGNLCDEISGFIGGIGQAILSALIDNLPYVREVMLALTVIVNVGSVLRSWSIQVTVTPASTHYGVDEVIEGRYVATIDTGGSFSWPAGVQSCARLAGLELPEPGDAPGSEITWREVAGIPRHVKLTGPRTGTVDESSKAEMPFEVQQEDEATHQSGGSEKIEGAEIEASVARQDVERLIQMVRSLGRGFFELPGIESIANDLEREITELTSVKGRATVVVSYHELLTATARWQRKAAAFEIYTCNGPRGPWRGTMTYGGVPGSPVNFSFPEGSNTTQVSGSFKTPAGTIGYGGTATLIGNHTLQFDIASIGSGTAVAPINYGSVSECR